ncbi:immunity protein Imm33 domain-containing protein [Roseateles chitinivorans]|uniref:immunity protein Imm33 domain-containing protein n=1 Tax=Roseateles chitinivorans TaxID=2917965 RepID=UPI003D67D117
MLNWQLDDPTDIAAEHKYTFYKPSPEVLSKVSVGEVVKLIFRGPGDDASEVHVERMWVLVDAVHPGARFEGRLDNDPFHIRGLQSGDPVSFEARHIINTEHHDPHDVTARYIKRAFVTNRILHGGQPICFLYREAPDEENDSGWRFTAGDETDEYMQDTANIRYVTLGAVLSRDDSVLHLLDEPTGSSFKRDDVSGLFVADSRA